MTNEDQLSLFIDPVMVGDQTIRLLDSVLPEGRRILAEIGQRCRVNWNDLLRNIYAEIVFREILLPMSLIAANDQGQPELSAITNFIENVCLESTSAATTCVWF